MQHQRGQASMSQTRRHNTQTRKAMQHQRVQAMSQTSRHNTQNPKQCSTKGVKPQCPKPVDTTPKPAKQCNTKGVKPRCPTPVDITPKTQSNAAPKGSSLSVPNPSTQHPNPQSNASMSQTSRHNTQNPKQCRTKGVKPQCPKPVDTTPKPANRCNVPNQST